MDPLAALHMICDLIQQYELDEVKHNARDLEQWLIKGGYYPDLNEIDQRTLILALLSLAQMKGSQV